jgi:hypothetical protein
MTRFCKDCRYLEQIFFAPKTGHFTLTRTSDDQDVGYRCTWLIHNTLALPWAVTMPPSKSSQFIGARHADPDWCAANPMHPLNEAAVGGSDWTEAMDCPTFEARDGETK